MKLPSFKMHKKLLKPNLIGSAIGIFEGCMPGAGGTIASFMSYNEARRWSKHPEEFGKGSPEAVAAPRSEEHTSELQSPMRISSAVFRWKKKKTNTRTLLTSNGHHTAVRTDSESSD